MEIISEPKNVKAIKDHICNFCGCKIQKGEIYNVATYKYDDIYNWKSHLKCIELVSALKIEGDEGVTEDDFYEYIKDEFHSLISESSEYDGKEFTFSFKEQVDFVYNNTSKLKKGKHGSTK